MQVRTIVPLHTRRHHKLIKFAFQHIDDITSTGDSSWNSEWQAKLEMRRGAEVSAKAACIAAAAAALATFSTERMALRDATMSKNRSEEQVKLESLEADLESVNPWERVVKLVDLQQEEGINVERIRTLLIQLKNEKEKV